MNPTPNLSAGAALKRAAIFMLCILLPAAGHAARSKAKIASDQPGREYVQALGVADRFLLAWTNQDHEAGLLLLSDHARHHESEQRLQDFFSAALNTQQGFEITRGKLLQAGRYSFPVALFESIPGKKDKAVHRRFSQIIVIRSGKDDWAVDNIP